jgi:predicted Holliday junction resolvase-like endonuclease
MEKLSKELKFYARCFCAELFLQELELPEVVFVGIKTGKFKHITTMNMNVYRIMSVESVAESILNVQLQLFDTVK